MTTQWKQIANSVAAEVIDEHERYDAAEVDKRIAEELAKYPEAEAEFRENAARSVRKEIERKRQPMWAVESGQLSMFDPAAILVLGGNQRVHMDYATMADVIAWSEVDRANYQSQHDAYNARQHYRNERQQAWVDNPALNTLGQLERRIFGFDST